MVDTDVVAAVAAAAVVVVVVVAAVVAGLLRASLYFGFGPGLLFYYPVEEWGASLTSLSEC